jgi:Glycosyl transferase family 90
MLTRYPHQLYVIATQGGIYSREKATLQSIYRAIASSPESLPNIEFAFNTDDVIFESVPLWGYARRLTDTHIWLIPDFGFWSWPETQVGTMREVQSRATWIEGAGHFSWQNKIPKLVWRGATMGLRLRDRLLEVSAGKSWADVVALDWHNKESITNDLKSMPEHCQYKYLAHTEGNSYSGRLKYLQACRSVVIAHKMDWMQHHHPLMHSSGPDQNYVEVDRDFDKLETTILDLEKHDLSGLLPTVSRLSVSDT